MLNYYPPKINSCHSTHKTKVQLSISQLLKMCILQVFLLLFLQAHHFSCDVVSIYENGNKDGCTNYSDVASIRDLPAENCTIKFLSEEFHLDSVLTIADRLSVVVRGMPSQLICSHTDTGIHIYNVSGLVLNGISLVSCGNAFNDSSYQLQLDGKAKTIHFMSSIYIFNCTDITIEQVTVTSSSGSGLMMFDNKGSALINDCTFFGNRDNFNISYGITGGGSGLHIVLSYCGRRTLKSTCTSGLESIRSSEYIIKNCIFSNNTAGSHHVDREDPKLLAEGFSRGGGLSIIVDTNSSANTIQLMGCNFTGNTALWGGGLYIAVVGDAYGNIIKVSSCTFINNSCTGNHYAGGGAIVGYQKDQHAHPYNNTVNFTTCRFESNTAGIGGGFSFYSSMSTDSPNHVNFIKSDWSTNRAKIGAAFHIGPQIWKMFVQDSKMKILFCNCMFSHNGLIDGIDTVQMYRSYKKGGGVLLAVGYRLELQDSVIFRNNEASAMHLTSTSVEVSSNANVTFVNNSGFKGGALYMVGFSTLTLNNNVKIRFDKNSAVIQGGAIYQDTFSTRYYFDSQSCFIKYNGHIKNDDVKTRNITVSFSGNTISHQGQVNKSGTQLGHSVYLATILPCIHACNNTDAHYVAAFPNCFGNFTFDGNISTEISTAEGNITMDNKTVLAVPGKKTLLPITMKNDLLQTVRHSYHVIIMNNSITSESAYMSNSSIRFYGEPDDEADVVLESVHSRKLVFKFHVKMLQCPPGFFLEGNKCGCLSETRPSIQSCNNITFEATLHHSYWTGYDNDTTDSNNLIYGLCPFTNCLKHNRSALYMRTLPQDTSAIENVTCDENYHGILCSQCREGCALHYNDYYYSCREIRGSCKRGWLLYIAMEIIPVTIFFVVVMVFNIQFTDGAVNGVILFIQISDTMLIRANGIIRFKSTTYTGLEVYRSFSRMYFFSMDQNEHFSFCLWERASTLDLLLFKYVTILYASTLVVVIIVVFKYCHSKTMNSILVRMKGGSAASTKSTIIHGMSGFLVICYSECARISFLLITPATLYSQKDNTFVKNVAYHNGELPFFSGTHLFYALPAILIILALGVLPPLILISYPLCYRVLAFLKIGETRFSKLLCTCIPLEKFKPFFDSFQSNFKDEYRFFSGLYFLYRFTTVATFAFSTTTHYYMIVQVQFAVIFALHAICQPYKKHWHNILDSLLFLNLSLVNIITYFSFQDTISGTFQHHIAVVSTIQVILLYLPLVYITIYIAVNIIRKAKVGSRASSLISRVKSKPRTEPNNYRQLESMLSLSIAEERKLD